MARNDNGGKRTGASAPVPTGRPLHRFRQRLESLRIGTLVTIAGITVGVLATAAVATSLVGTQWIRDAETSQSEWAQSEEHIHAIYNLASVQFLSIVDASSGMPAQFERPVFAPIATHAAQLISTTLGQRAESVGEEEAAILGAAANFDSAVADAVAADTSTLSAPAGPLDHLEDAFLALQVALRDLSDVITTTREDTMGGLSARADWAMLGLIAAFVLGIAMFTIAWALGMRIRQRERALQLKIANDRELLQTVVDALPESVIWKDPDSRVLGLNRGLEERLGQHNVGVHLGERLSDGPLGPRMQIYIDELEAMEAKVIETGEAILDHQMTRPELNTIDRTVLRNAIPLRHGDKIVGMVSTTRDITDVVNLERSLASARRLESIGQLSAGVAHEINTPVQYVTDNCAFLQGSFADLVDAVTALGSIADRHEPEAATLIKKQADLDFLLEEIPDAVNQSREGLDQIAKIVRAMKAFAHPGGDMAETDINSLVKTTVDVSRNEWKYHSDIELDLADDMPYPRCDEGQIKQVLLNMIINAADAIAEALAERGKGKGVITITTRASDNTVAIKVADTGTGIPPEVQKRMFERFFTTKPVGRGSGQGLAICYDAVTAHGGNIDVDSTVGAGTTFTITLPITPPEQGLDDSDG